MQTINIQFPPSSYLNHPNYNQNMTQMEHEPEERLRMFEESLKSLTDHQRGSAAWFGVSVSVCVLQHGAGRYVLV